MNATVPFNFELNFEYGVVATVSPLIRRVVAKNPSAFTFHGTGTYLVGHGEVAVIDPGPADETHIASILRALEGESITHLVVTHTHLDHSPASAALKVASGAPTYGFGPHGVGKGLSAGEVEEGADWAFVPDVVVRDGETIEGRGWTLEAVHTPGHTSNHLCYQLREEQALFSGDHVMGWSTTIVSPPDGDMGEYLRSLEYLLERDDVRFWPTHGPVIEDPKTYIRALLAHRRAREEQILTCLRDGPRQITDMVLEMYQHLDPAMHPAAALQVYSVALYLIEAGRVVGNDDPPTLLSTYALA